MRGAFKYRVSQKTLAHYTFSDRTHKKGTKKYPAEYFVIPFPLATVSLFKIKTSVRHNIRNR